MIALRRVVSLPLGLAVVAILCAAPFAPPVRAAEYTLESDARYTVNPDSGEVAVSVDLRFENTTPNPPGQFSAFDSIDLALQPGASGVTAQDADGSLSVATVKRAGYVVATVRPRATVRYQDVVEFTLTYALPDGASADVRVRPSAVLFGVWGFGTSGTVTVVLPGEFEVRVDGSQMTADHQDGSVVLTSGQIDDPASWLARITATASAAYTTVSRVIPLDGGTVDLQVRAWSDDAPWGDRIADLLVRAMPLLESAIGIPYPRVGSLVIIESVPDPTNPLDEPQPGTAEIGVAFNEPDFTVVHQAAHVWLTPELASDAWIREGFASALAERVAPQLGVDLPFDPKARAAELAANAFPLVSWGVGQAQPEQDNWAYAASWALADQLTATIGIGQMTLAWQRIAAGISAYDPVATEPPPPASGAVAAVDSRRLLDQLDAVSGAELSDVFAAQVFDTATVGMLAARATALRDERRLLTAAGDWGVPDPIRAHLAAWRFPDAESAVTEAISWVTDRDEMLATLDGLGLVAPARLRDQYRAYGGGTEARAELTAEQAVVGAYRSAVDAVATRDRSLLARVGEVGAPDPAELLMTAATRFGEGDLRGAADAIDEASAALDHAALDGAVRLASAAALIGLLVIGLVIVIRRRRSTGYTAAP